jgi:hypothetical protein
VMLSSCCYYTIISPRRKNEADHGRHWRMTDMCLLGEILIISKASSRPSAAIRSDSAPVRRFYHCLGKNTFRGWCFVSWNCLLLPLAPCPLECNRQSGSFQINLSMHRSMS